MSTALLNPGRVDLDNTALCPTAATCSLCGGAGDDLLPITVGTAVGVYCVTVCEPCHRAAAFAGEIAPVLGSSARHAVSAHRRHLGCDGPTMAALLEREHQRQWRAVATVVTDL